MSYKNKEIEYERLYYPSLYKRLSSLTYIFLFLGVMSIYSDKSWLPSLGLIFIALVVSYVDILKTRKKWSISYKKKKNKANRAFALAEVALEIECAKGRMAMDKKNILKICRLCNKEFFEHRFKKKFIGGGCEDGIIIKSDLVVVSYTCNKCL